MAKMTTEDIGDLVEALADLPVYDARPDCVERTRARAHAALARHRALHAARARLAGSFRWPWLEPLLAFGLCALYLVAAARQSLSLFH